MYCWNAYGVGGHPACSGEMFGPEQRSLTVPEQYGFVHLQEMIAGSERLQVVAQVTRNRRFLHWELEFADIFAGAAASI
jgi:hypothetical protein